MRTDQCKLSGLAGHSHWPWKVLESRCISYRLCITALGYNAISSNLSKMMTNNLSPVIKHELSMYIIHAGRVRTLESSKQVAQWFDQACDRNVPGEQSCCDCTCKTMGYAFHNMVAVPYTALGHR